MTRKHETVHLLPAENLLRELLLDCRNNMPSDPASSNLEMWFTGGWVRDKLLGIQSHDIDATLSTMTGLQFGTALGEFLEGHGDRYRVEAEKIGVPYDFKGVHVTARNPEKSKHLETAIIHIFGLDVDIVNLRKETYAQDSRNPQIEFGTAVEDADRRDATVNSLYYNLDRQQVEDFTQRGLDDMAAGVIRTPLEPYQTFVDDPLRVLRLIRFSSQFGYTIDEEAIRYMKDERIHAALNLKISRERVGVEVTKMMKGRNPPFAFELIYETNLYSTVFLEQGADQLRDTLTDVLPELDPGSPWPSVWPRAYHSFTGMIEDQTFLGEQLAQSEDKELIWLMVAYAPIAGLRHSKRDKAVTAMINALKPTLKQSQLLQQSLKNMDDIVSKVDMVGRGDSPPRSTIGMAMKGWGATWKLQVLYSLLAEVVYRAAGHDIQSEISGRYSKFMEYIVQQKLQDAPAIKPIINGNELKQLFELKKTGPFIKTALEGLVEWQFDHEQSSKEEAADWLRTQKGTFGIP